MPYEFPEPITKFPKADIPVDGLTAYLSQADTHQTLYMVFENDVELPEHSHEDQVGFVLNGRMELEIAGRKKLLEKGDSYHVPAGVLHSAKIFAGYADITVFMQTDRYSVIK